MSRRFLLTTALSAVGAGLVGLALSPSSLTSSVHASGTGQQSQTDSFTLTGSVRDFRPSPSFHPDFDNPSLNGAYARYVKLTLDADKKPEYSPGTGRRIQQEFRDSQNRKIAWCLTPVAGDNPGTFGQSSDGAVTSSSTFAQWFRDVPGVNMSTYWTMTLTKLESGPYAGAYCYETNDFFPFYPIDGQLFGNGPDEHNFYFTYEVACAFTYDASAGQFLKFKGDDDTWVFINNKLVIDHGGIAGSREYHIDFNRLGLTNGQQYDVRLFHAERKQPQSQFHLWTNVVLQQGEGYLPTTGGNYD